MSSRLEAKQTNFGESTISPRRNKYPKVPCPGCQRPLKAEGEFRIGSIVFPSYSCDNCVVPFEFGGATFEKTMTFCVAPDGSMFDPSLPESIPWLDDELETLMDEAEDTPPLPPFAQGPA